MLTRAELTKLLEASGVNTAHPDIREQTYHAMVRHLSLVIYMINGTNEITTEEVLLAICKAEIYQQLSPHDDERK